MEASAHELDQKVDCDGSGAGGLASPRQALAGPSSVLGGSLALTAAVGGIGNGQAHGWAEENAGVPSFGDFLESDSDLEYEADPANMRRTEVLSQRNYAAIQISPGSLLERAQQEDDSAVAADQEGVMEAAGAGASGSAQAGKKGAAVTYGNDFFPRTTKNGEMYLTTFGGLWHFLSTQMGAPAVKGGAKWRLGMHGLPGRGDVPTQSVAREAWRKELEPTTVNVTKAEVAKIVAAGFSPKRFPVLRALDTRKWLSVKAVQESFRRHIAASDDATLRATFEEQLGVFEELLLKNTVDLGTTEMPTASDGNDGNGDGGDDGDAALTPSGKGKRRGKGAAGAASEERPAKRRLRSSGAAGTDGEGGVEAAAASWEGAAAGDHGTIPAAAAAGKKGKGAAKAAGAASGQGMPRKLMAASAAACPGSAAEPTGGAAAAPKSAPKKAGGAAGAAAGAARKPGGATGAPEMGFAELKKERDQYKKRNNKLLQENKELKARFSASHRQGEGTLRTPSSKDSLDPITACVEVPMDDAAKAQFSDATFESVLAEVAAEGLRGAALEASLKEREETSRANCARDAEVAAELARRREAALELEQAAVARARAIVQERARALAAKVAKVDAHEAMLRANFGGAILAGMLSLVYMGELEKEDAAALAGAAAAGSDPEFRAEIERRKQLLLVVTEGGGGGQQQ